MRERTRKALALLLAVCMVLSLVPAAYARRMEPGRFLSLRWRTPRCWNSGNRLKRQHRRHSMTRMRPSGSQSFWRSPPP